jgi:hypothetical protein
MNGNNVPGPNAEFLGHAAVGAAGARISHLIAKPKTPLAAALAWFVGAAVMIAAHTEFDLPVAKVIAAVVPEIG